MAKNQMKAECITAVSAVMGRELTEGESAEIVENMRAYFVKHKQADPTRTRQEIVVLAAQDYANTLIKEAERKKMNAKKQALMVYKTRTAYKNFRDKGMSPNEAGRRILDGIDKRGIGLKEQFKSMLVDLLEKTAPKFLGLAENEVMIKAVLNEVDGVDTGIPEAKQAAEAWIKTAGVAKDRFNRAGGDIGTIDHWLLPQTHDRYKIINAARRINDNAIVSAGKAAIEASSKYTTVGKHDIVKNREAWVNFTFDRIDKKKYLDNDMRQMTDDQIRDVLRTCYKTITEDGANKLSLYDVNGGRGKSKANTRREHRTIHFKDANARYEYNSMFGENPSILGTMMSHIDSMANDISLIEELGPSPTNTFNTLKRMVQVENDKMSPGIGRKIATNTTFLDAMWKNLTGEANMVENDVSAAIWQTARNVQVFGKLGNAAISSLVDIGTYIHTSTFNKMPFLRTTKLILESFNPLDKSDKQFLLRAGFVGDVLNSSLARFVSDNLSYGVTAKLADATMRVTFLSQLTNSVRRAQSLNSMAFWYEKAHRYEWKDIDGWSKERLENFGIDEKMWNIFRECEPQEHSGLKFLTMNSIKNISDASRKKLQLTDGQIDRAVSTYLGFIADDAFMASLQPDLFTRSMQNYGLHKGTLGGEVVRNFWMFKAFPLAMIVRHFQRSKDLFRYKQKKDGTPAAFVSFAGYHAALILAGTFIGAVILMIKDLLSGSDIKTPNNRDFWIRAFTTGGGAGFVGDILVSALDDYKYGHQSVFNAFGPVYSTMLDAYTIFDKYKDDKDIGANVIRLAKGNLPFVNLWYTKQVINHAVFNQLQEMLNPGYHARIERKIQKNQGVGFWWKPTGMTPRRAPRIGVQPDK